MREVFGRYSESVMKDEHVNLSAMAVYGALALYADAEGSCFPSIETLIEALAGKISRRTVVASLDLLEARGHIVIRKRRHGNRQATNLYLLTALQSANSARADSACANSARASRRSLRVQVDAESSYIVTDQINRPDIELVSLVLDAGTEKAKKKPSKTDLPPELVEIRNKACARFQAEYREQIPGSELRMDAKENVALKTLATKYPDRLENLMGTFFDRIRSAPAKDEYWSMCPPTPRRLLSRLAEVEKLMALKTPPISAPTAPRMTTCQGCGKPYVTGLVCQNPSCPSNN